MSQGAPSVYTADTSPSAANQNLEERQVPSRAGMISSNRDLNIFNGTFYNVLGSVHHNSADSQSGIDASMQERALESIPGSVKGTIRLPRFSRSLLLRDLSVDTSEPSSALLEVSGSYDLASSLRLLPGQENEEFAEYDEVLVDRAVSRGQCYCGRISRHGLVFLISRHLQDITTVETTSGGSSVVIQTTFGRFKFYEQNDKSFVHFDRGTPSSNVDLVPNQKLEDILKAASGQYLVNKSIFNMNFVWQRYSGDLQVEDLATRQLFGIPDAVVIYMNKNVLENWDRLKRFSYAMLDAMKSVLDELEVPSSILEALKKLPNWRRPSANHDGWPLVDFSAEPADRLAISVYLIEILSHKMLEDMSIERIHRFIQTNSTDLTEVHQHFRSPNAEHFKLFSTSRDRFTRLFRQYSMASDTGDTSDSLRNELRALLISNYNNVALVVYQGVFAILSRWNCARVFLRAREAPEEWFRFIVADYDYIYIG